MPVPLVFTLGPFPFLIETIYPEGLTREENWRWEAKQRLGRTPILQYLGPDLETIEIFGKIIPAFEVSPGRYVTGQQLPILRRIADQGYPLPFISGIGYIFGFYVITKITEHVVEFLPGGGGSPGIQEFTITIQSYLKIL